MLAPLHARIKDPLPNEPDDNFRKYRRYKKHHPVKSFHFDLPITGQGQQKGQGILKGQGHECDVAGISHRRPPMLVVHQLKKIIETNERLGQTDAVPFMQRKMENLKKWINVENAENSDGRNNEKETL